MGKKIAYEEIRDYINNNNGCKLLTNKDEYINTHQELDIICKCGNNFKASYKRFKGQSKQQCNECGEKIRIEKAILNLNKYGHLNYMMKPKSHDDFIKDIYEVHGDKYTVLGEYINNKNKILVRHNKCGYEWEVNPNNFLRGSRCPICYGNNIKKDTDEFKKIVKDLVGEEYEVLGEYINANTNILMKHSTCSYIWEMNPANFIYSNARCLLCGGSKGENKIKNYLEDNNINFIVEYTFGNLIGIGGGLLRFDFYLPDYNLLIEYDGEFHYMKKFDNDNHESTKKYDKIKDTYCLKNSIPLIRIPYWDFNNIEKILDEALSGNDSAYFIA